jgi:hypothetical protein
MDKLAYEVGSMLALADAGILPEIDSYAKAGVKLAGGRYWKFLQKAKNLGAEELHTARQVAKTRPLTEVDKAVLKHNSMWDAVQTAIANLPHGTARFDLHRKNLERLRPLLSHARDPKQVEKIFKWKTLRDRKMPFMI